MTESEFTSSSGSDRANAQLERLAAVIKEGDAQDGAVGQMHSLVQREMYKGIFPHPEVLRSLDEVVPNGAERAFSLTEKEQEHRHEVDNRLVQLEIDSRTVEMKILGDQSKDRRIIIIATIILVAMLLIASVILALADKTLGAYVVGAIGLLGVIGGGVALKKKKPPPGDES